MSSINSTANKPSPAVGKGGPGCTNLARWAETTGDSAPARTRMPNSRGTSARNKYDGGNEHVHLPGVRIREWLLLGIAILVAIVLIAIPRREKVPRSSPDRVHKAEKLEVRYPAGEGFDNPIAVGSESEIENTPKMDSGGEEVWPEAARRQPVDDTVL
ncbi:hypothetical protein NL676_033825 [Syzygium grande]|nr:hypothetical protein NL676_033825 [Syzygium grande]